MNTKPSLFSFETKLHQLHAFALLASSESFLELDEGEQMSYLGGLNNFIAEIKQDFYFLHQNQTFNSSNL
jgi:hypothetical protein